MILQDALLPQDKVLQEYQRLRAGLVDMIEGGRLTRDAIPDDYDWLVGALVNLAGLDPEINY